MTAQSISEKPLSEMTLSELSEARELLLINVQYYADLAKAFRLQLAEVQRGVAVTQKFIPQKEFNKIQNGIRENGRLSQEAQVVVGNISREIRSRKRTDSFERIFFEVAKDVLPNEIWLTISAEVRNRMAADKLISANDINQQY